MSSLFKFPLEVEALYEFKPEHSDELELRVGETYTAIKELDDNWLLLKNAVGQCGIAPKTYVQEAQMYYQSEGTQEPICSAAALFDFEATEDWHLSLQVDGIYDVLEIDNSGWWRVRKREGGEKDHGEPSNSVTLEGLAPSDYLQPLSISGEQEQKIQQPTPTPTTARLRRITIHQRAPSLDQAIDTRRRKLSHSSSHLLAKGPPPFKAKALYDYRPQEKEEMKLLAGQLYTITKTTESGWLIGIDPETGGKLLVPKNFVEPIIPSFQQWPSLGKHQRSPSSISIGEKTPRPKHRPKNSATEVYFQRRNLTISRSQPTSLRRVHSNEDLSKLDRPLFVQQTSLSDSAPTSPTLSAKRSPLPFEHEILLDGPPNVEMRHYSLPDEHRNYQKGFSLPAGYKTNTIQGSPGRRPLPRTPASFEEAMRQSFSNDISFDGFSRPHPGSSNYMHRSTQYSSSDSPSGSSPILRAGVNTWNTSSADSLPLRNSSMDSEKHDDQLGDGPQHPGRSERLTLFEATSLFDYEPQAPDQLPLKAGHTYTILEVTDSGWWFARGVDGEGLVPRRCMSRSYSSLAGTPSILKRNFMYAPNSYEPRKSKLPVTSVRPKRITTLVEAVSSLNTDPPKRQLQVKNVSFGNIEETHKVYQWKLDLHVGEAFDFDNVQSITVEILEKETFYVGAQNRQTFFVPSSEHIDISHLGKGQSKTFDASTIFMYDGVYKVLVRDTNTWKVQERIWVIRFILQSDRFGHVTTSPVTLRSPRLHGMHRSERSFCCTIV